MDKTIFCANCQADTIHKCALNPVNAGEVICTCDCGRFVKLPVSLSKEEGDAYLQAHKENNQGQVSIEAAEKKMGELLS